MLTYPVKKVFITQEWGVNKSVYSRFGYLGHNGVDFRAFLPNGDRCYEPDKSEVFLPHDGKIIENAFDADGYGWYIKVENSKEGSVLAHLSKQSKLKVGQSYTIGTLCGYQGTTGFSTGIHLHWGYYLHPRDRSNGYGGTINQIPLLESENQNPTPPPTTGSISLQRLFIDSRVALLRTEENDYQPSDDELEYDETLFENTQKHIERLTGDHKFYDKWIKPHVDTKEIIHQKEIVALENAKLQAIKANGLIWQSKLDTANTALEAYKLKQAKNMSYSELFNLLFKKLKGR